MNINIKITGIILYVFCGIQFCYGQENQQLPVDTIIHKVQRVQSALQTTDNGYYVPTVVPVAPNAASLGIYGSMPIGHYTGIPNINIPLYEIDLDGKKIPISISYHAAGVKVAQEASWVGLGWALNAGGCITHEIAQEDDFGYSTRTMGYYFNQFYPTRDDTPWYDQLDTRPFSTPEETARIQSINDHLAKGNIDIQPDNFYYNFGDYSGSMFFARADPSVGSNYYSPKAILKYPKEHLDVTVNIDGDHSTSWVIYDGDGYKYYFGGSDNSRDINTNYSEAYSNVNGNTPTGLIDEIDDDPEVYGANQRKSITAWYLDSIVSPLNHKVVFTYRKDNIVTPFSLTEDRSFRASQIISSGGMSFEEYMRSLYVQNNYSYASIQQSLLDKITFPTGEINFQTIKPDRKDLFMFVSSESAQKLDRIDIRNKSDLLKSFVFNYEYPGDQGSYKTCRMTLKGLTESSGNQMKPPYVFTYYKPEKLPPKYSKNIDFWGYYNNKINNLSWGSTNWYKPADPDKGTLIPTILIYGEDPLVSQNYQYTLNDLSIGGTAIIFGADRSPNAETMKYGVLTSIQYPTGGTTEYTYEPNTFINNFESGIKKVKIASIDNIKTNAVNSEVKYFELNKNSLVYFKLSIASSSAVTDTTNIAYLVIEDNYEDANGIYELYNYPEYCINCKGSGTCGNIYSFPIIKIDSTIATNRDYTCINLKEGKYRAYVVANPNKASIQYSVSVDLGEIKKDAINSGAGLRIKEIKDISSENSTVSKVFNYTDGVLTYIPGHFTPYSASGSAPTVDGGFSEGGGSIKMAPLYSTYILGTSHSLPPNPNGIMENTQSEVGYSKVEEITGIDNGRIVYSFYNTVETYPNYRANKRGVPLKTAFYRQGANDNQPIKTVDYEYYNYMLPTDKTTGCYALELPYHRGKDNEIQFFIAIWFYDLQSFWLKLTNEITTEYTNQGNIITNKEYQYNDYNYLPEKITTKDNQSKTIIEKQIKYPYSYTTAVATGMKSKHLVNAPIETLSLKNNMVVSAMKTEYSGVLNTYLPTSIYKLNTTTPEALSNYNDKYSPEVFFDRYSSAGKYTELHGKDGVPIVYIWSYNNQYPIAEIKNAHYSDVQAALGYNDSQMESLAANINPDITDLRNKLANYSKDKPVFYTTYTYKLLVGIWTATDQRGIKTTYNYDPLNRLMNIQDLNGNSLKAFDYHYKQ